MLNDVKCACCGRMEDTDHLAGSWYQAASVHEALIGIQLFIDCEIFVISVLQLQALEHVWTQQNGHGHGPIIFQILTFRVSPSILRNLIRTWYAVKAWPKKFDVAQLKRFCATITDVLRLFKGVRWHACCCRWLWGQDWKANEANRGSSEWCQFGNACCQQTGRKLMTRSLQRPPSWWSWNVGRLIPKKIKRGYLQPRATM